MYIKSIENHKKSMSPVPLCSNCVALMFDDIGPLIPNRLNPIKKQQQTNRKKPRKIKKTIGGL